jgi:hypothetical protein
MISLRLFFIVVFGFLQGISGPIFGQCPGSRDWLKESSGNPLTGMDWIRAPPQAPKRLDDTDDVMRRLALKKIDAFSQVGHGFYFWNFRTDLYEPQWSYMAALDRGWIPKGNLNSKEVQNACLREDENAFKCVLKRGQIDSTIHAAVAYALKAEGISHTPESKKILALTGPELETAAKQIIGDFFEQHRLEGGTCDFGGVAMLIEENRTLSDDDTIYGTDDEYYGDYTINEGPKTWIMVLAGLTLVVAGGLVGFSVAMHKDPNFNRRIRESTVFMPIAKSKNKIVRSFAALAPLLDDEEVSELLGKETDGPHY